MQQPLRRLVLGVIAVVVATAPTAVAATQGQDGDEAVETADPVAAAEPFPGWLPAGGLYGEQKWVPGSYGVDVFLPRGAEIRAPVAGIVVAPAQMVQPPPPIPAVALRGDNGLSFFLGHVQPLVAPGARVAAGAPLAVVDDPVLDRLGSDGPGPSGWQHVDLNVSQHGWFTWWGGDVHASLWLQQTGYDGTLVERTPAPPGPR
jgi:hypothetical protein